MIKVGTLEEFKNGWFIGDFEPSLVRTPFFEIAVHDHKAGDVNDGHIHKIATEFNIVLCGQVLLEDNILVTSNGYWITEPNQNTKVKFIVTTRLLVVKIPSVPGDKYENNQRS